MKVTRVSPMTGRETTLDLPVTEEQMKEWESGRGKRRLVQDIFPALTPDQREFIMTGYTAEDWQAMFPPVCECGCPPGEHNRAHMGDGKILPQDMKGPISGAEWGYWTDEDTKAIPFWGCDNCGDCMNYEEER